MGEVTGVDKDKKCVLANSADRTGVPLPYDFLVLATGVTNIYSDEIGSSDHLPMRGQELAPSSLSVSLGSGFHSIRFENVGYGSSPHAMAEITQGSLDVRVSPIPILSRHLDNQSPNFRHHLWSSRGTAYAAIVFLGDQLPMPREQSLGSDQRRNVRQYTATQ
jgi:hypothetical protein